MIVELVDESGETLGRFQSPAVPRRGEELSYAEEQYVVENVSWFVETTHDQNVEQLRLIVSPLEQ